LKATNPTPANGAIGVAVPLFQWTPGETGVFDDVYWAPRRNSRQPTVCCISWP